MVQTDGPSSDDNPLGLPTFTQPSSCLAETVTTEDYDEGVWSTYLILGVDRWDRGCISGGLPATRCPSPYEPVATSTNTDLNDDEDIAFVIYCCPS